MIDETLEKFRTGSPLAASRLMSVVERGGEPARAVLDAIYAQTGAARRIAVTGGTGAGKSTLIDRLVARLRVDGQRVGVIAEDPTSPLTGGAVLGDRIRMQSAVGDCGVFVRSIASRGADTGFSPVAVDLCDVLVAFGCDAVILETTGVGQNEHRVMHAADTVVVVLTPESGDDVQGLKAGILEIGDVFAVNKADRPGADAFAADLADTLSMRPAREEWTPPVVTTTALHGAGVDALYDGVAAHAAHLASEGRLERRRTAGLQERIRALVLARVANRIGGDGDLAGAIEEAARGVGAGGDTPWSAADQVAGALWGRPARAQGTRTAGPKESK